MQEIKKILSSKQNIVITTHVNPDGDAIGSSIALLNFLIKQGHNTSIIVPNDYPDFLKWMKNDELIITNNILGTPGLNNNDFYDHVYFYLDKRLDF